LVNAPLSSRKLTREKSPPQASVRLSTHASRCAATSGLCCSAARSDFFSRQAQLRQPGADGLPADAHAGAGVQIVGQFAAEGVGLGGHQLTQHLLLLLVAELGRVTTGVRTRLDAPFLAVVPPDAACSRRRAGHDLGHVIAFQAALDQLNDPSSHRQRKSFHAAPRLRPPGAYITSANRATGERASL
jgi:hypothetical protein